MSEPAAIETASRPWTLAALAGEDEFDRHVEAAATTIADRFALKVHINIAARRRAHADWIDRVRAEDRRPLDYRALVSVCAGMIGALAAYRVVGYTAMMATPGRTVGAVIRYGNEVTALAVGGALYALAVEDVSGASPAEPLPALVIENAAASLRRHPEAALRFRELLRLSTPWM